MPDVDPSRDCMHWRLSPEGRMRAQALADRLVRLHPDAVYSSPEPKALETATIIGAALDLTVRVIAELREHDRTGVPFFTAPGEFEGNVRRLFATPDEQVFGAESAAAALHRFTRGMNQVLVAREKQPLVVTHGTVMSLYIGQALGTDPAAIWAELSMPCYIVFDRESATPSSRVQHLQATGS